MQEPWAVTTLDDVQLNRLRSLADEQFSRFEASGKTGKLIFWETERARILRDLERYVGRDIATSSAEGYVPVAVELAFGTVTPPVIVEAAGRQIRFSGFVDRVDRAADGRLVVADYKSGRSDGYKGMSTEPLGRGRRLQLPIYAKAARLAFDEHADRRPAPVRAEYRFVQAAAGYAVVPVELTEKLDAELSHVLGTIVSTIDAGCFPPRPGAPLYGAHFEHCRYCDYDSLCTTDRAQLWDRATDDPRMKAYSELVSGSNETAPAGEEAGA